MIEQIIRGRGKPKNQVTLFYIIKENKILLAMKKRGFGVNKWNGYGGKVKSRETIEEAGLREFKEESKSTTRLELLEKFAELDFYFEEKPEYDQTVHIYKIKEYFGEPQETEEMKPEWFDLDKIPYDKMWDSDRYFLPLIIKNKKLKAKFLFRNINNENIVIENKIQEISKL